MKFFKPEDFNGCIKAGDIKLVGQAFGEDEWRSLANRIYSSVAHEANELLETHLATLRKVYGKKIRGFQDEIWSWDDKRFGGHTHEALLWDPKEIEK